MKIEKMICTKNDCYKDNRFITPTGLMLHSVGCSQPSGLVFAKSWNKANLKKLPHAIIDANTGVIYQTLDWNRRGWHGGGASNNTHIGVEMGEPNYIKYTKGSTFTIDKSNIKKAQEQVTTAYNSAVELFAFLCKKYNLNPLGKNVIISHSEGHSIGIASNHADPEHLWKQLNMPYTMNSFRNDVNNALKSDSKPPISRLYKVQVGAYRDKNNALKMLSMLKEKGFTGYIVEVEK